MSENELPGEAENVPPPDLSKQPQKFGIQTLNKRYLLAIPVGVVILLGLSFSPSTLDILKTLLATLNGGSLNGAEYFSAVFALVGGFIMLLLALSFLPDYECTRLALMLEMAGAGIGWVMGMFLSPTSQSEQQTFLNAKTAIVGILSGYILSKLQSAFDKVMADGRLLNLRSLAFALVFFIPLLLSTSAVYNVRAYQDLNVKISFRLSDVKTNTENGITTYSIELNKSSQFIAEARVPDNTSVAWSLDPAEGHGTINQNTGEYVAPSTLPNDPTFDIVAMSLEDKTKVSRLPLTLVTPKSTPHPPAMDPKPNGQSAQPQTPKAPDKKENPSTP